MYSAVYEKTVYNYDYMYTNIFSEQNVCTTSIAKITNIILKQMEEGESLQNIYCWPLK